MENQDQNTNQTPPAPPVVQVMPTSSQINPPTSRSKFPLGIIIGIILFLLVAGSAAGFYALKQQSSKIAVKPTPTPSQTITPSPAPNPTANWNKYTVSNQFEFKYPIAQYSIGSGPTSLDYAYPGQLIVNPNDSYSQITGSNIYSLTISPIINKNHLTLQNVGTLLGVDNSKNQFPPKTVTIGGIQGVRYDGVPGQVDRTEIYIIKQDKNYADEIIYNFTLRTQNGAKASAENETLIQNILSTFKFTQ